jgi:hypothetical protein
VYDGYRKWLDAGIDPVRITLDESKKRGVEAFFSYRINTEHDFSGIGAMGVLPPMKQAHPEWLIPSLWPPVPVWDFEFQGVRDFKLSILREVVQNYDFDGIEIDWRAGGCSLPQGHKWEKRAYLSEFMRSVRMMMLEETRERKPMLLVARVSDSVEGCHLDGFDVETWAKEGLIDILVIGGRSLEVDITGFRRVTKDTGTKLIAYLDDYHASDGYRQPPLEVFRGLAANWWAQEPDGICTFNFAETTDDGKSSLMSKYQEVWSEIGDSETLKFKDKTFVVQRRFGEGGIEAVRMGIYFNTNRFAQLPVKLANDDDLDTMVFLTVGDDVSRNADRVQATTLRIKLSDPSADDPLAPPGRARGDCVEVTLNGVLLSQPRVEDAWLVFDVKPDWVAFGRNVVGIRVTGRDFAPAEELSVEKIELHVTYQPQ